MGGGAVSPWETDDAWEARRQEEMDWWEIVLDGDCFVDFDLIQKAINPMYAMHLEILYD